MPFKYKIYNVCSIYSMLYGFGLLVMYVYFEFFTGTNDSLYVNIVSIAIITVLIAKPIMSFRYLSHYKNNSIYKNWEQVLFVLLFVFQLVAMVVILIILLTEISDAIRYGSTSNIYFIISIICTGSFLLCGFYVAILDLPLAGKLRRRQKDLINTLGEEITE